MICEDLPAHKKEANHKSASHRSIGARKKDEQGVQLLQLQATRDVSSYTHREIKETQKEEQHASKSRDSDVASPTQRKTHETGKEEQHVSKGKQRLHSSRDKSVASSSRRKTKETQKEEHRVSKGSSSSPKASTQKNNAKDGLFSSVSGWISQAFGR